MNSKNKTFSHDIKYEILSSIKNEKETKAFSFGFLLSSYKLIDSQMVLKINDDFILDKVTKFFKKSNISYEKWKNSKTMISVNNSFLSNIYNEQNVYNPDFINEFQNYFTSFFAGVFVASGNVSGLHTTSYHLDISTKNVDFASHIQDKLNQYQFGFKILQRKDKYFLYIKKLDNILEFLAAIGAQKAWLKMQDMKIQRDLENVVNRINNIDMSNLQKIAKSSLKHIQNINYIFKNNLEDNFTENELVFFRLKLENQGFSLSDLSKILEVEHNIFITKGGLGHWLKKLEKIVKEHQK